ncbi:DNA utilization protein GntX [Shewanella sp. P1-14-1]|uniref:ComF family protein n=1 Tax=Shewanella sp. P1-14-1 TaxID=1723761 RepID=UPI0006D65594|nr:ComF family protein [Shewanella sp. P1-14-1]KPZ68441.1 DNA utilization protein GntX [Shewanella sp. P1-14-1]
MDWQLPQAYSHRLTSFAHWLRRHLPNRCLLCRQDIRQFDSGKPQTGICHHCLVAGLYQHEVCLGCGKRMEQLQAYCGHCLRHKPVMVIAPCSYHHSLGELVSGIKYQQQCAPLTALVNVLAVRVMDLVARGVITLPQVIVPVPLHKNRLKQRGFNQAWLIADELSRQLGIPMDDSLLVRNIDTQAQAGLDGQARRRNCADAFNTTKAIPYQRVALIDDVVTTGTTVNEIGKLFAADYVHVQAWCLARAEAPGLL